jgi:hypothetical protein
MVLTTVLPVRTVRKPLGAIVFAEASVFGPGCNLLWTVERFWKLRVSASAII